MFPSICSIKAHQHIYVNLCKLVHKDFLLYRGLNSFDPLRHVLSHCYAPGHIIARSQHMGNVIPNQNSNRNTPPSLLRSFERYQVTWVFLLSLAPQGHHSAPDWANFLMLSTTKSLLSVSTPATLISWLFPKWAGQILTSLSLHNRCLWLEDFSPPPSTPYSTSFSKGMVSGKPSLSFQVELFPSLLYSQRIKPKRTVWTSQQWPPPYCSIYCILVVGVIFLFVLFACFCFSLRCGRSCQPILLFLCIEINSVGNFDRKFDELVRDTSVGKRNEKQWF